MGTLSDIQGRCNIGNYVSIHSNVFICEKSKIKDYMWIFPHAVLTNDSTPPSNELLGVTIETFAILSARSVVLPGVHIYEDALVGAGSVVTKDIKKEMVVIGNAGEEICSVRRIKNKVSGD